MTNQYETLQTLLSPSEVWQKDHANFELNSRPWSKRADLDPPLVLAPATISSLQKAVKYLYDSDLDFSVRNTGTGSTSARDVVLSMSRFKSFTFDEETQTIEIGAGLAWGEVDALMEEHAPGFAAVGARCGWVGVTGSALVGGLSWLSHEFGMISDPQNMLDVQIVLADGRVVWSSQEPDLDWALRGGGGNFGVVAALKFRVYPYTSRIFSGVVMMPYSSLHAVSKAVSAMAARPTDPKVAMHVVNQGPGMGVPNQGSRPGVAIMMFDANGEAHARSEAGFKWAFDLPDAQSLGCQEMSFQQVNALADTFRDYEGTNYFWLCAPLVTELDEDFLVRAWKWYEDSIELCPGLGEGSTVLLEFMQEGAYTSTSSRSATGWPHSGRRHVMQLVLGCRPENAPAELSDIVMAQFKKAAAQIARPEHVTGEYHPGFLHDWNNLQEIYAENFPRLQDIKRIYDPQNRFNKSIDLAQMGHVKVQ